MVPTIIDRIVHHAEIIKIDGDSFRTKNYVINKYFFIFVGIF